MQADIPRFGGAVSPTLDFPRADRAVARHSSVLRSDSERSNRVGSELVPFYTCHQ